MIYRLLPVVLLLCSSGCIRRSVTIDSDPPGARVYFDHREAGETPLELRFTHYGGHSLIVVKEGFRPYRGRLTLDEKGWAVFPVDIVTEALLPSVIRDRRNVTVVLQKAQPPGEVQEGNRPPTPLKSGK